MRLIRLLKTDMLNIVRDRSLVVIFFLPFIILALLRIAPPLYEPLLPEMILFRPLLLAMFCLVVSALAGFLMAFILLDEKDLQLQPVFRVMPFPYSRLIALRTFFILCLGFIFCLVLILWSHLIDLTVLQALVLAFCCSLAGPTATLLLVLLAQNKIEGVTYFKLFNVILAMPIAGLFLAQPYSHLFGVT